MSSSPTPPIEAPFAASGGIQAPAPAVEDPFDALDALMSVIEALCPVWPERPLELAGGTPAMLL